MLKVMVQLLSFKIELIKHFYIVSDMLYTPHIL